MIKRELFQSVALKFDDQQQEMRFRLQQLWALQYKLNMLIPKEELKEKFTFVVPLTILMQRIAEEYEEQDILKSIDFSSYFARVTFTQIMLCVYALW